MRSPTLSIYQTRVVSKHCNGAMGHNNQTVTVTTGVLTSPCDCCEMMSPTLPIYQTKVVLNTAVRDSC